MVVVANVALINKYSIIDSLHTLTTIHDLNAGGGGGARLAVFSLSQLLAGLATAGLDTDCDLATLRPGLRVFSPSCIRLGHLGSRTGFRAICGFCCNGCGLG